MLDRLVALAALEEQEPEMVVDGRQVPPQCAAGGASVAHREPILGDRFVGSALRSQHRTDVVVRVVVVGLDANRFPIMLQRGIASSSCSQRHAEVVVCDEVVIGDEHGVRE